MPSARARREERFKRCGSLFKSECCRHLVDLFGALLTGRAPEGEVATVRPDVIFDLLPLIVEVYPATLELADSLLCLLRDIIACH